MGPAVMTEGILELVLAGFWGLLQCGLPVDKAVALMLWLNGAEEK